MPCFAAEEVNCQRLYGSLYPLYFVNRLVTHNFTTGELYKQFICVMMFFRQLPTPPGREIIGLLANKSLTINRVAGNFRDKQTCYFKTHKNINGVVAWLLLSNRSENALCAVDFNRLKEVAEWSST